MVVYVHVHVSCAYVCVINHIWSVMYSNNTLPTLTALPTTPLTFLPTTPLTHPHPPPYLDPVCTSMLITVNI